MLLRPPAKQWLCLGPNHWRVGLLLLRACERKLAHILMVN